MASLIPGAPAVRRFNIGPAALTAPIVFTLAKVSGGFGAPTDDTVTVISTSGGNTWVEISLDAVDTDTPGDLCYHFIPTLGIAIDPPADFVGGSPADVIEWLEFQPSPLFAGCVPANVYNWLDVNVNALVNGDVPCDVQGWLGTAPEPLTGPGNVPCDVKMWLTSAPSALDGDAYLQVDVRSWDANTAMPLIDGSRRLRVDVETWNGFAVSQDGNNLPNVNAQDAAGVPFVPLVSGGDVNVISWLGVAVSPLGPGGSMAADVQSWKGNGALSTIDVNGAVRVNVGWWADVAIEKANDHGHVPAFIHHHHRRWDA